MSSLSIPSFIKIHQAVVEKKSKMWKFTDGRTGGRTDDGRCAMTIAHSSLRFRWAKNTTGISIWIYPHYLWKFHFSTINCLHIRIRISNLLCFAIFSIYPYIFIQYFFIFCCDFRKASCCSSIEVNDKHWVCLPTVMAQNMEYFGL